MKESILVSGAGIVSSLGVGKEPTLEALRAARRAIGRLKFVDTVHSDLPVGEVDLSEQTMRRMLGVPDGTVTVRTALLGMLALREALSQAAIDSGTAGVRALISGTTVGGMEKSEQYYRDFLENDSRNDYIRTHDAGASTCMMADMFGPFDTITTISTACSSAANAIILGADMIRCHKCDIAVVGGSECLTKFHLNGFNTLKILDPNPCRPFDASREGLNLGEGAAFLVLESEQSALRRGVKPLCRLAGYGNACDAYHQTASSPDGEGAFLSMQKALHEAEMVPSEIDYINAHGTGTPNNDLSEGRAIERVFADCRIPPVSSTKAATGHTTSASGAIEAVISILAINYDFVPVNLGFATRMEELHFSPATDLRPPRPIRNVLTNSFGFGGNDTSCIFSKI